MPWRPLGSIVHAVCVHHFDPTEADDLALQIGDEVYITEANGHKDAQWCRGWLLSQPSVLSALNDTNHQPLRPRAYAGIFPRGCVQVREGLAQTDNDQARAGANGESITNGVLSHEQDGALPPKRHGSHAGALVPLEPDNRSPTAPKEQAPLPALRVGETSIEYSKEPLIGDISSCIREWHSTKLHALALQHDYKGLEELATLVDRLDDARKQLAHNVLTQKELAELREQVVWDLVKGNKMVDNHVIVRSVADNGRMLTAKDNLSEMLTLQSVMSLRDKPVPSIAKETHLNHLLVDIRDLPQHLGEPAMLHMYLCAVSGSGRPRPVSEAFAVELFVDDAMQIVKLTEDVSRTLFTNLSKADVGGEDESDHRLYLICRLFRDEPFRRAANPNIQPPPTANPSRTDEQSGLTEGNPRRRSLLLNMRSRRGSDAGDNSRPATSASMRTKLQRNAPSHSPTLNTNDSRPSTGEKKLRRAAGWAAVPVSSLITKQDAAEVSMIFWTPAAPFDDGPVEQTKGDGWDDVLRLLCHSPNGRFAKAESIGRLTLTLQSFAHDNVSTLIREKPALLRQIQCTPALGLNGDSRIPRSDIYVTLKQPVLPPNARSFDPNVGSLPIKTETDLRNLQVTLEVRTSDGRRIEDCIYPTSNRAPHTAFRTPAVDRGESWNQTIRLSVPSDEVSKAHIIMSLADGPYFPFALAWVPLWNEKFGFPEDGQQSLALWDYNEFTANLIDGRGAYLSLPATLKGLSKVNNPAMASISVETYLSSTTATQNGDVLELLHLARVDPDDYMSLLDRFQHVPDEEVVKFFVPLLTALAAILEKCSEFQESGQDPSGDELAEATLKALTQVFRLTRDRRYPHLAKLLDDYVSERRCTYSSRLYLIRALRSLLSNPFDARNGRNLRAALKVTDCILKFSFSHLSIEDDEEDEFRVLHRELREFFEDVMVLLTNSNSLALPTQVIVAQSFASWLPEIATVLSGNQTLGLAIAIVDACSFSKSQLRLQRLVMIHRISCLEMFQADEMQAKIITKTASWLRPYWPEDNVVNEKLVTTLRLCCTIIRHQQPYMAHMQAQYYVMQLCGAFDAISNSPPSAATKAKRKVRKQLTFSPLFQTSHPFQNVAVNADRVPNEILLELTAVIGGFFQEGLLGNDTGNHYTNGDVEIGEADASRLLSVLRSIQSGEAFPESWLSFAVSFAQCQTRILNWLLSNLLGALPDSAQLEDAEDVMGFDEAVWEQWFDAVFALVTSSAVVMEDYSDQKRRAIWTIGGDIREVAAVLLQRAWNALGWENDEDARELYGIDRIGGFQVQFTTRLIPSIINAGLALHSGLRRVALEILRSMIIAEWELSTNLDIIQSAFADAFDAAFRDHRFEPAQAAMLLHNVQAQFVKLKDTRASNLYRAVMEMLQKTRQLVDLLSHVHAIRGEGAASDLEQRMRLLEYLKAANNEDSYVRHVHDISAAQAKAGNFSAAALALELHVDVLILDSSLGAVPAKAYPDLDLPSQSVAQRQEVLFSRMNDLFKKGHCWDRVLSALEERNKAYSALFDSNRLVQAHEEQAEVYKVLTTGKGYRTPRYFRVNFSDSGLPSTVAGKSFVFEAAPDEDTAKFAAKMRQQYPSAVVVHPGVPAPKGPTDAPVLRISTVNVNRNQLHPINQQSNISPFFRVFHLTSRPTTFATSTRQEKPGVSVMDQTVEKTIYHTKEALPTLVGRSEIVGEESVTLTPVQAAIDRTHRKTLDIAEAARSLSTTEKTEDDKLIRLIQASVDPVSVDSVVTYHKLLLEGARSERTSITGTSTANESVEDGYDERALLQKALYVGLEEHARAIEAALQTHFDSRLTIKHELRDKFEVAFEPELYAIYPSGLWRVESRVWNDPAPVGKTEDAAVTMAATDAKVGSESDTETEKRPRSRRASLRKRLSFLSLSKA